MTHNLASSRRGIPRGGVKGPIPFVSNSPNASKARPAARRGRSNASPS